MILGTCPNCGTRHVGWALRNPKYQTCRNCRERLDINEHYQTNEKESLKPIKRNNLKQTKRKAN